SRVSMKRIDSLLERFVVNEYQGHVRMSPSTAKNTTRYTPATGRTIATTRTMNNPAKASENGSPAVFLAIIADSSVPPMHTAYHHHHIFWSRRLSSTTWSRRSTRALPRSIGHTNLYVRRESATTTQTARSRT